MGNNSSISENVAGDGELLQKDERELLGVVSALLKDDEALAEHCRELWAICGVDVVDFVPAEELQPVTQRLIDRMACRHPTTLERIGAVYTSFAGRQGLSLLEFQGYVACVLTQISRELEARVSGNLHSLDGRDDDDVSEQSSVCKTTPFAATFADSTKEAEVENEKAQKAPEAELSDIQKLTQELTSLNVSLSRHVESMEVSQVDAADADITGRTGTSRATDVESRQAKGEGALETNPTKEPQEASEMATLLTTLENLNRSLSQADQSQNHPSESSLASSQRVQSKASQLQVEESVQSSHAKHNARFVVTPGPMHMPSQSQQSQQSGYPGALAAQMAARAAQVSGPSRPCGPCGPWVHSTHCVEAIFPEPVQGGQGVQGVQALPPAEVSAIFDPGNTYARAVRGRGNVSEMPPGDVRAWTSMDVEIVHASQAETGGELPSDPAEALRPMANAFSSRLNGASKGIAHSWQAFADTMDSIFVPEARHNVDVEVAEPEVLTRPEVTEAPAPQYEDVPAIFRQPTVNEVQEVLEQEGLPAYVAIASAGTFCAKKLCLDSSSSPSLYVLEPDSSIPAVFFGMQGFCLDELRRIVLSEAPLDSTSKPLLSLEFEEGFLPVRLGSALVLRGLVGVLCHGRHVWLPNETQMT